MHRTGAGDEHLCSMGARNIVMGRRSFGSSIFLRLSPFSVGDVAEFHLITAGWRPFTMKDLSAAILHIPHDKAASQ